MFPAFTSILLAAVASRAVANGPMRLGSLAMGDLVDDIPSMARAAAPEGNVTAIELTRSQVLPCSWYADVFLAPYASAGGVRHGRVVHLQCFPASESDHCTEWKTERPASEYVLIESDPGPRPARRPIRLDGEMRPQELRSLVAFIRTSPHPHETSEWVVPGIDGHHPITDIRVDEGGIARVSLKTGYRSGFEVQVRRTRRGWVLVDVVYGVG